MAEALQLGVVMFVGEDHPPGSRPETRRQGDGAEPAVMTPATEVNTPAKRGASAGLVGRARRAGRSRRSVWGLAVLAAAGGAVAGCHPTSTPIVDPLYTAVFAGLVALACGRAARGTVLWAAVVAAAFSRGWLIAPAAAALVMTFAGTFARRRTPAAGALGGALAVQVVLRWPGTAVHGATALLAAVAAVPCLVGGWLGLSRRGRRWVAVAVGAAGSLAVIVVVPVILAGLASRQQVTSGIDESKGALTTVSNGGSRAAVGQLDAAASDFAGASARLGAWWTAGARLVPVAAQQRQALAVATSVAYDVAHTAAGEASTIDYSQLRYRTGGIDLARLTALEPSLQQVGDRLSTAVHKLQSIRSAWLVQPVASRLGLLDQQVTKASSSADLALTAVRDAPALLGADGTRHYFVAFIDTSESRGLGGIIASYAELTAIDGHLSLTSSGDVGQLNQQLTAAGGVHLRGPAQYLDMYGSFQPQDYFQDPTYAPDLPTVADVISQMYAQSGHGPIDGVMVLDPRSVASLLRFTGPVQAAGLGQLNSANAEQVLTTGEYQDFPNQSQKPARLAALQTALTSAFGKLTAGSLPGPRTLAQVLGPDVRSGDLLFWSTHRRDKPLLARMGLTGSFPSADGHDLLSVITQNASTNKIDAYLQRSVDDRVSYDPGTGQVVERVQIVLHNKAPSSGLPDAVIGSYPGSGLPLGTNLTWLNVYSPLRLGSARVEGRLVGLRSTPQYGVNAYSGFVSVPPGATVTVSLRLQGYLRGGPSYEITVHRQPTVLPDRISVNVQATPGWAINGPATWIPGAVINSSHRFDYRRA